MNRGQRMLCTYLSVQQGRGLKPAGRRTGRKGTSNLAWLHHRRPGMNGGLFRLPAWLNVQLHFNLAAKAIEHLCLG